MAAGFALGLASNAFAAPLSATDARVGIVLAGIAWVYLGFAVAHGPPSAIAVQAICAAVFLNVAFVGVQLDSALLLGLGYVAHAGWDWLHYDGHRPTRVRTWYPRSASSPTWWLPPPWSPAGSNRRAGPSSPA